MSMRERQNAGDRQIAAVRRLRASQGAKFGDGVRSFLELAIADPQFAVIRDQDYVQKFVLEDELNVRILDSQGLMPIGNARFAEGPGQSRHAMLPVSYDGTGMFWWPQASPVVDPVSAIKDDALSFVDSALSRGTWGGEHDALQKARDVLSVLDGSYAVLPDNTVLTGSAAPGFRLVDDGRVVFLEMFDQRSDGLRSASAVADPVPLVFGILEYAAAEEFLERTAERMLERQVAPHALVERRDTDWVHDFTQNRQRWADGGFFTEYVSALIEQIAILRPVGNKELDKAIEALRYRSGIWLYDHEAVNAKVDEILRLRDLIIEVEPKIDDLLAERLKWSYKVKPLEVLEIRTRGIKELIAEPALSPSP